MIVRIGEDMDINKFRMAHMAVAEFFDAWRIIPRILVAGYGYLIYWVVIEWYTKLTPYILDGCVSANVVDCIIQAPTNAHTALVVTVIGIAAPMLAFYTNTSKKWNGFTFWGKKPEVKEEPLD